MTQESNVKLRLQELDNLDKRRLKALQSVELYQAHMAGSFDKKVRQRAHKMGDLVLAVKRPMVFAHKSKGKFEPKWEGPFVIDKVLSNGAYVLLNMEGERCMLAHQWQVLEAVLPLKTSYNGSEQCLHGQSLFVGTCSSNPPLLEFSSLC
ncbi:hypothetical protein MRB53_020970 [Persea americana]|uniref:Uncharacterized protein n=1 Tax=Persea americana TaxID=3435 RepID=A0ACC2L2R1_PERAE|nr:hypothetical protein MRB53_020970 [Persea americana]